MKAFKEVLSKKAVDVFCDVCGKSCKNKCSELVEDISMAEFATLEAYWGYCSKKDGTKYNLDICESCFDKIMDFINEKIQVQS